MTRTYKRKEGVRARLPVNENNLRLAVKEVLDGNTVRGTAKKFALCVVTLSRYVNKKKAALRDKNNRDILYTPDYQKSRIFNLIEEEGLIKYFETARTLNEKLSPLNMRKLAYKYARENNIKVPPNWHVKKSATYDWFHGFRDRYKSLLSNFSEFKKTELEPGQAPATIYDESRSATQDETADSLDDDADIFLPVKQETTENEDTLDIIEDEITNTTRLSSENMGENISGKGNKDECDTFGQLIAHKLRKLSARNKLLAERRITDILFNLELEELDPLTGNRGERSFAFVSEHTKDISN